MTTTTRYLVTERLVGYCVRWRWPNEWGRAYYDERGWMLLHRVVMSREQAYQVCASETTRRDRFGWGAAVRRVVRRRWRRA